MKYAIRFGAAMLVVLIASAAAVRGQSMAPESKKGPRPTPATAKEAAAFLAEAEPKLLALANEASRAGWVQSTYITDDTEALAALANERLIAATAAFAEAARRGSTG